LAPKALLLAPWGFAWAAKPYWPVLFLTPSKTAPTGRHHTPSNPLLQLLLLPRLLLLLLARSPLLLLLLLL
jgi:hypothetical protein